MHFLLRAVEFEDDVSPLRVVAEQHGSLLRNRDRSHALAIHRRLCKIQQLLQLRTHPVYLANNQRTVVAQIGWQIRIFELHLQYRFHRAQRIAQIVRHGRGHLPEQSEPLALRQFTF